MDAARVRLRPVLMTAFTFILGVVPMVIATGAGAASRNSLGTTVFGGMLVATMLSLGLVPVLYVVLERLRERVLLYRGKSLPFDEEGRKSDSHRQPPSSDG
jgi:Cu/Ag efflux pump CusA